MKIISIVVTYDNKITELSPFEDPKKADKFFAKKIDEYSYISKAELEKFVEKGIFEGDNGYTVTRIVSELK